MWSSTFHCLSLALKCNVEEHVPLSVTDSEMYSGGARSPVCLWLSAAIWMRTFPCISLELRYNVEQHVRLCVSGTEL
jgi:hypothetical protein